MPSNKEVTLARRQEAYSLLGVTPESVVQSPKITSLFKRLKGGWTQALIYLRYSDSPTARRFLSRYDNILYPAWVRSVLPVEAFCVAAKVSPIDLWDCIVDAYRRVNQQLASIAASDAHTAVVEGVIERAMEGDKRDVVHVLKHMQFLPQAKSAQVSVTTNVNASANAAAATLPAPPPEDTIRRMANRFNVEKPAQILEGSVVAEDHQLAAAPEPTVSPLTQKLSALEPAFIERED